MKIGIMTHHWGRNNYGQYLQHYALQTYLRSLGHEPFLIDYVPNVDRSILAMLKKIFHNPIKAIFWGYNKGVKFISIRSEGARYETFLQFKEEHFSISALHYSTIDDLCKNPPKADIYLVGSDQVWNSFDNFAVLPPFFLDFGKKETKRIAYAASWGRKSILDEERGIITPLIKRFQAVSVREHSGIALCEDCGYSGAIVAPDPTLLLSSNEYRKISSPPKGIVGKYIFFYRLWSKNGLSFRKLRKWAESQNLEIKYITGNNFRDIFHPVEYPSIAEWLWLIDHAEYVITDSFHCSIFAMFFKKKFAVLPLRGKISVMNVRLDSLFKDFKITPRYLNNNDFTILDQPYQVCMARKQHLAAEILTHFLEC